jgi:hypothetical protein
VNNLKFQEQIEINDTFYFTYDSLKHIPFIFLGYKACEHQVPLKSHDAYICGGCKGRIVYKSKDEDEKARCCRHSAKSGTIAIDRIEKLNEELFEI